MKIKVLEALMEIKENGESWKEGEVILKKVITKEVELDRSVEERGAEFRNCIGRKGSRTRIKKKEEGNRLMTTGIIGHSKTKERLRLFFQISMVYVMLTMLVEIKNQL